jgi:hypothetical protein
MQTQKEILPINLTTKVKDINGQVIQLYIEILIKGSHRKAYLHAKIPGTVQFQKIGGISYSPTKDFKGNRYLYIEHMRNLFPHNYKNVGSALHEHVFRESYELDCGGHVRLSVGSKSHYFHYRCGFSPHPPFFYPEAQWLKIFARLREAQPEGPLNLPEKESYDLLHLSDQQIQSKALAFQMNAPIVAISREIDWVKNTLQAEGKVVFKALYEDNDGETHKLYTQYNY